MKSIKSAKTILPVELKQFLGKVAQNKFLKHISPLEKEVLFKLIEMKRFTNSEISKLFNKKPQNVVTYFNKFLSIGAIGEDGKEGRNVYYKPTLEAKWLKLRITELEIRKSKEREESQKKKINKKIEDINNMKLSDFFD